MARKVERTYIDALFSLGRQLQAVLLQPVYASLSAARNADFGGEQSPFPFCPFQPVSYMRESARVLYLGWRRGKYGVGVLDRAWELTWSELEVFGRS